MTGAHSTALYRSRINLLLITRLISFTERRRRNRILALIRVHQVLSLHLLLILILNVRLCISASNTTLTRTALGIRAIVARCWCHTAVYDNRRSRVILYGSKRRRGTRRTGDRGRLWLRIIGVRDMHAVIGLRRRFWIVV